MTSYIDGISTRMSISTSGASATAVPISVYYGVSSGASSITGLTLAGTGTLSGGTSSVSVSIAEGTWYVYIRLTSPSSVAGPLFGNASTVTSRGYSHASGFASYSPTSIISVDSFTLSVSLSGYDTVLSGKAAVYYSLSSTDTNPTQIGSESPIIGGVATITSLSIIPYNTYYLYGRTISHKSVPGPLFGGTQQITFRGYKHATAIASYTPTTFVYKAISKITLTFTGYDTVLSGNAFLYYSMQNNDTNPTQIATTSYAIVGGTVTIPSFIFSPGTGTCYIYARTISSKLEQGPLLCASQQVTVRDYTVPSSFTVSLLTTLYTTLLSLIQLNFSTADGLASANVIVYYDVASNSINPTQFGTGTVEPTGIATIFVTFPISGNFYIYAKVTAPNGTVGSLLVYNSAFITVLDRPSSINFKTFNFASTSDAAAVTTLGTLPTGFSSTAAQTNLTSLSSYYRDINGEWAPVSKTLVPPMVRCEYSGTSSVDMNLQASGYAVIIIQGSTYRNDNPSVIWSTSTVSSIKTAMCSAGGNTYVGPSIAPETAITFVSGINSVGELPHGVTRQTQVKFVKTRVTGESNRWYNGIKEAVATTAFDGSITQTPSLGAAGGVQLQDFITVHQFSSSMKMSLDSINNTTYTTIGSGTSNTTPYCCTTTTNRSGGARFAEFAVVTANLASDDLLSLANDYANKWRVPFAGPTIKTFRLVNTGTASLSIGYFAFGSKSDMSINLMNNPAYGAATYSVSSGSASSATTWQGATLSTAPHQIIPANGYLQIVLNTPIENAGFLQFGLVTFATGAQLGLDINYTSGIWERYDLYYNYGGAVVNTTTTFSDVGSNIPIYAKNGVLMPWKQKYRTNPNEDVTMPYSLPLYNISRESNISYLNTLSSNLMAVTWDANRAVKWIISQSRSIGATLTENQVIVFNQHTDASQQAPGSYFVNMKDTYGVTNSKGGNARSTTDGLYNLSSIEATRYDYIPLSVQSQYVSYVSRAIDTIDSSIANRYGLDFVNTSMAIFDPVTLQSMYSIVMRNNERLDINLYLRKSPTGKYYIGTPKTFGVGDVINGYRGWTNIRMGAQPLNSALRSMFGLTVDDPSFGNTIDTLDLQKKYTICSYVCNNTMFMSGVADVVPIGEAISIFCTNIGNTTPFVMNLSGSTCTDVQIQLGNCIRTPALGATPSVFGPPKYKALRSCTSSGMAINDIVTYPTSYSQERIFIFTVVIDTTVGGANFFNDDAGFEKYAKCYINGKRVNTASRRTINGTNYVTCTTNVGTSPTSYPSYFAQSSSLTYGISQVTDMTVAASGGNPSDSTLIGGGVKYSTASKNSANSKSFNSFGVPNGRRKQTPYGNTVLMLETKTESRSTTVYTSNDVDTHIANLSAKWGIVMAYRWITIKNIGTVDFRFGRLNFNGSHVEAINDSGGNTTDQKTGASMNIMRGFTTGVSATTSSATIGSNGITAVMSSDVNSFSGAVPGAADATLVTIQPGGYITIDLSDPITCSHLTFGKFGSTGDVSLARMSVELTPTLPENENKGTPVTHILKASYTNNLPSTGQFPLFSPETRTDTMAFLTNGGVHLNSYGVYLLFSSVWSSVYNPPTSFTYSVGGTVYVSSQTVVSITTSGADATPAAVAVYASTSQTDPVPGQILVCESAGLSATGSALATCVFPTTGTYYLFIKATGPNGTIQSSFVGSSSSAITVVTYSLPTSISAATIGSSLVVGTSTGAGTQSLTLSGGGNIGALSAANISVYIGAPGNCTVTNYNTSNGVVSFTAKPTVSGMCMLYAIITAPITGSTQTTSLVYTGATSQGFFVDVSSSTYTMPTSFTYSPTNTYVDVTPSNMTVTTSGSNASVAIVVYYGASANATTLSGLTACGSGTLASNSATISVTIPSGTWYVYVTVTSPLGVLGSILGTASTLSSRAYIQAGSISSFTPLVPVQNANTTFAVTLGGYDTVAQGTASVYYSTTTSDTNPTFIGKAALVSGVVTVTGKVPLSSYYLYARTASSLSVQGNLIGSNTILNTRSYNFPTSVSFTQLLQNSPTTFTFSSADTLADANVKIYYHATNSSILPTPCGSGIVNANGSANITCDFPTTAVYVYALVTSPAGVDDILRCSTSSGTAIYGLKRSITHSGTLSSGVSGTITFTISPTPISNANVKVYYHTSSTSLSPTQCGTGTSTGNTATTSCTIPSGAYYLYISLDIDFDKISTTSGIICLDVKILLQTNPTGKIYNDTSGTTLTSLGGNVRMWKDLAGGSYNYISGPSSPYPVYAQIGGVNAIYLENSYLSTVNGFLNASMSKFTFEILIYPTSRDYPITLYVRQNPGSNTYDWVSITTTGTIYWHQTNTGTRIEFTGFTINLNVWSHIVVTSSGLYLNGNKVATNAFTYSGATIPDNHVIIGWAGVKYYLAEYNVYSYEMTDLNVSSSNTVIRTKYGL